MVSSGSVILYVDAKNGTDNEGFTSKGKAHGLTPETAFKTLNYTVTSARHYLTVNGYAITLHFAPGEYQMSHYFLQVGAAAIFVLDGTNSPQGAEDSKVILHSGEDAKDGVAAFRTGFGGPWCVSARNIHFKMHDGGGIGVYQGCTMQLTDCTYEHTETSLNRGNGSYNWFLDSFENGNVIFQGSQTFIAPANNTKPIAVLNSSIYGGMYFEGNNQAHWTFQNLDKTTNALMQLGFYGMIVIPSDFAATVTGLASSPSDGNGMKGALIYSGAGFARTGLEFTSSSSDIPSAYEILTYTGSKFTKASAMPMSDGPDFEGSMATARTNERDTYITELYKELDAEYRRVGVLSPED